jgi:hypothetical protein
MNISEKICREAYRLPEALAHEVLDFIGYLKEKHGLHESQADSLKLTQMAVMRRIWDNDEDEVWNDL